MSLQPKTWPYGTTRRGTVVETGKHVQMIEDDQNEAHVLMGGANDPEAKVGDTGTLTFTKGGPTGGYWRFEKDE